MYTRKEAAGMVPAGYQTSRSAGRYGRVCSLLLLLALVLSGCATIGLVPTNRPSNPTFFMTIDGKQTIKWSQHQYLTRVGNCKVYQDAQGEETLLFNGPQPPFKVTFIPNTMAVSNPSFQINLNVRFRRQYSGGFDYYEGPNCPTGPIGSGSGCGFGEHCHLDKPTPTPDDCGAKIGAQASSQPAKVNFSHEGFPTFEDHLTIDSVAPWEPAHNEHCPFYWGPYAAQLLGSHEGIYGLIADCKWSDGRLFGFTAHAPAKDPHLTPLAGYTITSFEINWIASFVRAGGSYDACKTAVQTIQDASNPLLGILLESQTFRDTFSTFKGSVSVAEGRLKVVTGTTTRDPSDPTNRRKVQIIYDCKDADALTLLDTFAHELGHAQHILTQGYTPIEAVPFLKNQRQYVTLALEEEYQAYQFEAQVLKEMVKVDQGAVRSCPQYLLDHVNYLSPDPTKARKAISDFYVPIDVTNWIELQKSSPTSTDPSLQTDVKPRIDTLLSTPGWSTIEMNWNPFIDKTIQ